MTGTNDSILVYGATGVQGGAVLDRLRTDGHSVLAQTSTPDYSDALEATGVDVAVARLDDPDALVAASEAASQVVLSLPQGYSSEAVRQERHRHG